MEILELKEEAINSINGVNSLVELNNVRTKYLSKKGLVSSLMANMRNLSIEEKKTYGAQVNELKNTIEALIKEKEEYLNDLKVKEQLEKEAIDVTMPSYSFNEGTMHPLSMVIKELEDIFLGLGYEVATGPELECDEYCFEKLNLPKGHPARDMQDTFYLDAEMLLRSQTSPVQVREMLKEKGKPIAIICPGKTYRRDQDDATHSHQFMQCEGLVLGKDITLADLKGALLVMAKNILGEDKKIRLRPSYFPFTEPSVEVDVSCVKCGGKGCSMCKNSGWIEILGAGMVNNNVLRMCGYDPEEIQGFAFGVGIERITMLKYGIEDIRNFYMNDLRFLKQFKEAK